MTILQFENDPTRRNTLKYCDWESDYFWPQAQHLTEQEKPTVENTTVSSRSERE